MRALLKKKAEPGLWLEQIPVPEIGINDVLIKVDRTGICGTDLHIYLWNDWARKTIQPPLVIGHEFTGTIVRVGSNVKDCHPGDVVSGEGHVVCGRCRNCLAGRRHLCADSRGIGIARPGAFAEYLTIPVTNVWHHEPSIPREVQAIFDPLGNAVHTALSFDVLGEDVLITGAGPIGLMAAAIVKHAGARYVVISDVNPYRLNLARKVGVSLALDARRENISQAQKKLGMKEGFDVGLEMAGHPQALKEMLVNMCHGGKIALLGIPEEEIAIDWNKVIFNGLTIKGIYGREMYESWYKATVLIQSGVDFSSVVTHRFHYSEYEKAFEVIKSGQCGKVLLDWSEDSRLDEE
jgi:threonine 3-dehydrogenase